MAGLGKAQIELLQRIHAGGQPKDGVITRAQVRSVGNALRALLSDGLVAMGRPFEYRLTDKGRAALFRATDGART